MNLKPAIIELLTTLCTARVVTQDELVRFGFDLVALVMNTKQLANCGLTLKYLDTRRGYAIAPSSITLY